MGLQLRWLERTPDKGEVDGPIPFRPTIKKKNPEFLFKKLGFKKT